MDIEQDHHPYHRELVKLCGENFSTSELLYPRFFKSSLNCVYTCESRRTGNNLKTCQSSLAPAIFYSILLKPCPQSFTL
jgi:hypothetical protein